MTPRWMAMLFGVLLASAASAAPGDKTDVVRDLAGRVGPILGSALACPDIARPRVQAIADKFAAVIKEASSNEAERDDLTRLLDRNVADGRGAVTSGRIDCRVADRQLADLEQSIAGPTLSGVIAPSSAAAATVPAAPVAQVAPVATPAPTFSPVRGVTDREIRFGIAAPFSGSAKELGRQMKLGIDTAFNRANDTGRNAVGICGELLVQPHERALLVLADEEADDDQRSFVAGRGVDVLDAGYLPEQLLDRPRDALFDLGG